MGVPYRKPARPRLPVTGSYGARAGVSMPPGLIVAFRSAVLQNIMAAMDLQPTPGTAASRPVRSEGRVL
ncbi:MAG: hypothetical protein M3415_07840, partial [Actinomycetota bacterium]|nr:hypothetical protein [Actinomycetota bacterium]